MVFSVWVAVAVAAGVAALAFVGYVGSLVVNGVRICSLEGGG